MQDYTEKDKLDNNSNTEKKGLKLYRTFMPLYWRLAPSHSHLCATINMKMSATEADETLSFSTYGLRATNSELIILRRRSSK